MTKSSLNTVLCTVVRTFLSTTPAVVVMLTAYYQEGDPILACGIRGGEAAITETDAEQAAAAQREAISTCLLSSIRVPLAVEEYRVGVLELYAARDAFASLDRSLLERLGACLAVALQSATAPQ